MGNLRLYVGCYAVAHTRRLVRFARHDVDGNLLHSEDQFNSRPAQCMSHDMLGIGATRNETLVCGSWISINAIIVFLSRTTDG